jgi:hypothetical protein
MEEEENNILYLKMRAESEKNEKYYTGLLEYIVDH